MTPAKDAILYFNITNKWSKTISRGSDIDNNNIVELDDGKIIIDYENRDILDLQVDKDVDLDKYFEGVNVREINWRISDESILEIKEGHIIPKKVGETDTQEVMKPILFSIRLLNSARNVKNKVE